MIEVKNLSLVYPEVTIFKDLNFEIEDGKVVSIIGPSAAGKASLLKSLAGLVRPTSGQVFVDDMEVTSKNYDISSIHRKIGYVFSDFNLFSAMTVIENIMTAPVKILGKTRQEAYDDAIQLLSMLSLTDVAFDYPHQLTVGQKQRVAILRALAMNPKIMLFDSPTFALDAAQTSQLEFILKHLAKELGCTVITVSDDLTFVRNVSDSVIFMDLGRIYEMGSVTEVLDHPEEERVVNFVKGFNKLEKVIDSKGFDYMELNADIERFGRNRFFSKRRITQLCSVFEELVVQMLMPELSDSFSLKMIIDCTADTKDISVTFAYTGNRFNPFENGDEISLAIVNNCIEGHAYEYLDGSGNLYGNKLVLNMKPVRNN